jgi:hypothetical protein
MSASRWAPFALEQVRVAAVGEGVQYQRHGVVEVERAVPAHLAGHDLAWIREKGLDGDVEGRVRGRHLHLGGFGRRL